ncbi:hypothetical protein P4668_26470 [Priestia megaterium]|jgi:hypothetical protein|uniref:hypothetical protein n=1 Tax=Priestia megaterium TaxID=1404 RepID=UPI002E1CEDB2|nr:hypothetical protein [Priestia megaterium]
MVNSKIKKVLVGSLMSAFTFTVLITPNQASAAEKPILHQDKTSVNTQTNDVHASFVNDYRNVKKNVKKSTSWSSYKRVSDNISTGSKGGTINATKAVTFSPTVSGNISGLNISLGGSKSSSVGYTLNAGANKRVYMGYRVKYSVEKGENHRVDVVTGKTVSKSNYTVKKPMYGEYKLLNY